MALVLVRQSRRDGTLHDAELGSIAEEEAREEAGEFLRRDSNIGRIESAFDIYKAKATGLVQDRDPNLITREVFTETVSIQQQRFYGCLSVPFSLIFFVVFALSTFLHEDITNAYVLESGLEQSLGKGSESVESVADVWAWIDFSLIPTLFEQGVVGESEKELLRPVLTYNTLTGPLVIEQLRSEEVLCSPGAGLPSEMTCFPDDTRSTQEFGLSGGVVTAPRPDDYRGGNTTFEEREDYWSSAFRDFSGDEGRRLRSTRPEFISILPSGTGNFRALVYPNTPTRLVRDHLAYLKARRWLDQRTLQLTIKALLLNAELGRPRLEQFQVVFTFSRAGGIYARIDLETILLRFWADLVSMGVDFMWLLCLVFVTVLHLRNARRDYRSGALRRHVKTPWNLLQWSIVVFGWICMGLYAIQIQMIGGVLEPYRNVVDAQLRDVPAEANQYGAKLHDSADNLVFLSGWFRVLLGMYHLLLMIRFFTAFHAQPRLGVVTSTLEVSLVDIVHFLIVVLPTFMAYAISGCFIFGRRIEDFATFESAIGVCFKVFMESEYDWPDLTEEHYWTAAVWTWSFMFLLVLIMLNMVLAIILDVYTEIRKRSGQSEPVWATFVHILQQVRHADVWISNQELLSKAPSLGPVLCRADLMEAFPTMCEEQLDMLVLACRYQSALGDNRSEDDAKKLSLAAKLVTDRITETARELHEGVCDSGAKKDAPGRGWLPRLAKEMAVQNHLMLSVQWQLQQLEWQWQAVEEVHGSHASFDGRHRVPAQSNGEVL